MQTQFIHTVQSNDLFSAFCTPNPHLVHTSNSDGSGQSPGLSTSELKGAVEDDGLVFSAIPLCFSVDLSNQVINVFFAGQRQLLRRGLGLKKLHTRHDVEEGMHSPQSVTGVVEKCYHQEIFQMSGQLWGKASVMLKSTVSVRPLVDPLAALLERLAVRRVNHEYESTDGSLGAFIYAEWFIFISVKL